MFAAAMQQHPLFLYKTDPKNYPKFELPCGFTLDFYKKGDEVHWANLECSIGQFDSLEAGIGAFEINFLKGQALSPEERIMFVKDRDGEYIATCALWDGDFCGGKAPLCQGENPLFLLQLWQKDR